MLCIVLVPCKPISLCECLNHRPNLETWFLSVLLIDTWFISLCIQELCWDATFCPCVLDTWYQGSSVAQVGSELLLKCWLLLMPVLIQLYQMPQIQCYASWRSFTFEPITLLIGNLFYKGGGFHGI